VVLVARINGDVAQEAVVAVLDGVDGSDLAAGARNRGRHLAEQARRGLQL
jgi:hypothetical protein